MEFPTPVVQVAVEPRSRGDQDRLDSAIQRLAEEDPSFRVHYDTDSDTDIEWTILRGADEPHLEILTHRIRHEFGVAVNVGRPQVAYRETIRRAAEAEYTHKKQTCGTSQFARVRIRVEPLPGGGDHEFVNRVSSTGTSGPVTSSRRAGGLMTRGRVPREFVPSVDEGCRHAMRLGVLAGFELTGVRVTLLDGAGHSEDSSELAFRTAAFHAFREVAAQAEPVLLEPVMDVEVTTPEEHMGDVIGDLNTRRGQVRSVADRYGAKAVSALVPLAEMFGYAADLRSRASDRANHTMRFDSHAEAPKAVAAAVIAKAQG